MCHSTLQFFKCLSTGLAGDLSYVSSLEDAPCWVRKPLLQRRDKVGDKLTTCCFKSHICPLEWMVTEGVLVVHLSQMRPVTIMKDQASDYFCSLLHATARLLSCKKE